MSEAKKKNGEVTETKIFGEQKEKELLEILERQGQYKSIAEYFWKRFEK